MHPYQGLADSAFWRSGVAEASPFEIADLYAPKFLIRPGEQIATAGSCFAQHISRELRLQGCTYMDVEPAPSWLDASLRPRFGYEMYSARYGNIYTMAQLSQLAQEAAGLIPPHEVSWERDGAFFDPLRPGVEPEGLASPDEVATHRRFHVGRVKGLVSTMDVFIFTLGLTEAWRCRRSGRVYPTAPGVLAGTFDPEAFAFVNLGYAAVLSDFNAFIDALRALRSGGAPPKIILTVSPVPLTATASGGHVLQATSYSKAVLRAAAGELAASLDFVDYFPSYEVITNPAARGVFYDNNLRSVRQAGVDVAMRLFATRALADPQPAPSTSPEPRAADAARAGQEALQCEEAVLEAFGA